MIPCSFPKYRLTRFLNGSFPNESTAGRGGRIPKTFTESRGMGHLDFVAPLSSTASRLAGLLPLSVG